MNIKVDSAKALNNPTVTGNLAEFVVSTRYDTIPEKVLIVARSALLDWLGVCIAGSREPSARLIAAYARKAEACREASAICQGFQTTTALAALVNGTASHAIDFDDTFANGVCFVVVHSLVRISSILQERFY